MIELGRAAETADEREARLNQLSQQQREVGC